MRTALLIAGLIAVAAPPALAQPLADSLDCETRYEAWLPTDEVFPPVLGDLDTIVGGLEGYQRSLRYPTGAVNDGAEGTVWIWLLVGGDGAPHCIRVHQGVHPLLDEEAVRGAEVQEYRPSEREGGEVLVIPARFRLR